MKKCNECNINKELSDFYKNGRGGYRNKKFDEQHFSDWYFTHYINNI